MTMKTRAAEPSVDGAGDGPGRDQSETAVADLVVRRFPDVPEESVRTLAADALAELGEVRVRTFLPVLVERRVKDQLRRDTSVGGRPTSG